jgi:hypothetical protein
MFVIEVRLQTLDESEEKIKNETWAAVINADSRKCEPKLFKSADDAEKFIFENKIKSVYRISYAGH